MAEFGAIFQRPDRKGQEPRFGGLGAIPQWIESVFDTLKDHGRADPVGRCAPAHGRLPEGPGHRRPVDGWLRSDELDTVKPEKGPVTHGTKQADARGRLRLNIPLGPVNKGQQDAPGVRTRFWSTSVRIR